MSKTVNHYNVNKDGEHILHGVTNQEAAEVSGCDPGQVSTYAKQNRPYHGKDGVYMFYVSFSEQPEPKHKEIKPPINESKEIHIPEWLETDWNNMRIATRLLKTGYGHFVTKNGRKYVEVNL